MEIPDSIHLDIKLTKFIRTMENKLKTRLVIGITVLITTLSGFNFITINGILSGQVLNQKSGANVAFAKITLTNSSTKVSKNTVTGADGTFTLKELAAGKYVLEVTASGFAKKYVKEVVINSGKTTKIKIILSEIGKTEELKAITSPTKRKTDSLFGVSESLESTKDYNQSPAAVGMNYEVQQEMNTEQYDYLPENEFHEAARTPLSTFSIDVDPASYANVRRFITDGSLPPVDAVRIEELVNYFKYDYPQPQNNDPFSINTEISVCPWNQSHQLISIGLQGKIIPTTNLPPTNLVFLLDVSGSMLSNDKLPLLKKALTLLTNQLRSQDRVAIVVYAGNAGLVLPSTPGSDKETILNALESLSAGGSTAGGAGIQLAYTTALSNFIPNGNNRVILATDGDFNVGASSDGELVRMIEARRDQGIYLTVLGFGTGNLKDSKMEKLADKGNGNYAYIDNIMEAKKVLVNEMGGTLFTIAKDVKLQLEFNPELVKAYKLIGYENRILQDKDFNDDKKDAGELGSGHTVTALYEIVPAGSNESFDAIDELKYQKPAAIKTNNAELLTIKFRYKEPNSETSKLITRTIKGKTNPFENASLNHRFAASVAAFGLLLRDSKFKANASYEMVLKAAKSAKGNDAEGYRAEFIRLVETAQLLSEKSTRN